MTWPRKGGRHAVDITRRACPFESTAVAVPDTVCELHVRTAHGTAEGIWGLEVDELIPRDPRRVHCRLRCHVEPPQPGARP